MGIPHSTQTRIRCFGWFFEKSLDNSDMMATPEGPGADTSPANGMRRINGPGGLQKGALYSDPSALPTDT